MGDFISDLLPVGAPWVQPNLFVVQYSKRGPEVTTFALNLPMLVKRVNKHLPELAQVCFLFPGRIAPQTNTLNS